MIIYLNGTLVERSKAHLSLDDRGFLFGEGAYEVTRAVHGSLFETERHIARLERTLRGLEIDPDPLDLEELFAVSERLVRDNGFADAEAIVYLQITRGASFPAGARLSAAGDATHRVHRREPLRAVSRPARARHRHPHDA